MRNFLHCIGRYDEATFEKNKLQTNYEKYASNLFQITAPSPDDSGPHPQLDFDAQRLLPALPCQLNSRELTLGDSDCRLNPGYSCL